MKTFIIGDEVKIKFKDKLIIGTVVDVEKRFVSQWMIDKIASFKSAKVGDEYSSLITVRENSGLLDRFANSTPKISKYDASLVEHYTEEPFEILVGQLEPDEVEWVG